MRCRICGGYVEWKGPLVNLTHTECAKCGGINCQEVEMPEDVDEREHETRHDDEQSKRGGLSYTHGQSC